MEKQRIQVITQITFVVEENGKKTFQSEKPLMAVSDKDEAIKTIKEWNDEEIENWKRYKGMYHLEFQYKLTEITLW